MCDIKKWAEKHKEEINFVHLIASVITIIALFVTVYLFRRQINIQNKRDLNEHISNIKSLNMELKTSIALMNNLIERSEEFKTKLVFETFVTENIKDRISDGRISNRNAKNQLIIAYIKMNDIDNLLNFLSSPEISINDTYKEYDYLWSDMSLKLNETDGHKEQVEVALSMFQSYEICLTNERDIEKCNTDVGFNIPCDTQ